MAAKFTFGAPTQSQTTNPFGSLGSTSGNAFGAAKTSTGISHPLYLSLVQTHTADGATKSLDF